MPFLIAGFVAIVEHFGVETAEACARCEKLRVKERRSAKLILELARISISGRPNRVLQVP